jgi:hypothetical protein
MDKFKLIQALMGKNASLPYQTNLPAADTFGFANWAERNRVPVDLSPQSDYDMTGYYRDMLANQSAQPSISALDNRPHFTDKFKTPYHQTFSKESIYAGDDAPHWEGNALRNDAGNLQALELPDDNILSAKQSALQRLTR